MATVAAGASANSFLGFGQTVTLTTAHNVNGRYYFAPQNAPMGDYTGMGKSFGPGHVSLTIGPFSEAGTIFIENFSGSAAVVTYTVNNGTSYPATFSTLSVSSTVSGAGFTTFFAAPPSIGTTTPGIVKASNLQATYLDSSGTPGNVTNSSPRGRAAFAAASSTVVVTSTLVAATSTVLVALGGSDATLTTIRVTPGAGSFTVTGNAVATATTPFDFLVVN